MIMWNIFPGRGKGTHETNAVRVLRLVREHEAISRIEIARATDLHKATITEIVARLIEAGFLVDTGETGVHRKVGRKERMLRFLPLAGIVVGVDIRASHIAVALTDLNAHIIIQDSFPTRANDTVDGVMTRVATTIRDLLKASKQPISKLISIGIAVPGIVDCSSGTMVLSSKKPSWQGEPLGARLEQEFGIPVYAENDVKSRALCEYLLGAAKGTKDFVYLFIGDGLGAGIMINGRMHHGISSAAGEIGLNALPSAVVNGDTFPMTFHNQKYFGDILTNANLVESYRRNVDGTHGEEITVPFIAERSRLGDHAAQQIIAEYVSLLEIPCSQMVYSLNPAMFVLGGNLAELLPGIADMLQVRMQRSIPYQPAEALRVRCAVNGEPGALLGAAALVLHRLFEPV
jgi:predicted NBD/HSP70 family sugar kinase